MRQTSPPSTNTWCSHDIDTKSWHDLPPPDLGRYIGIAEPAIGVGDGRAHYGGDLGWREPRSRVLHKDL
eukprot:m.75849 g.75849  ORF g.75849 m.75849 type:complete len:69 (-) comp18993_c0_seq13:681-887(-)